MSQKSLIIATVAVLLTAGALFTLHSQTPEV
jgi:hypothetical protein